MAEDPGPTPLVIVRHGPPTVERGVLAAEWRLAPSATDVVVELAGRLPHRPRLVVTSPEPKAVGTATLLAPDRLDHDPRLREVRRLATWNADYEQTATRYLTGAPVDGWEPVDAVRQRMVAATRELAPHTVVVGHGLALSLLVAVLHDVDVASFWQGLGMPDAWAVGPRLARVSGVGNA